MTSVRDTKEVIVTSDNSGESFSAAIYDPRTGSLLSSYKNAAALAPRTLHILDNSYILGADLTKPRLHIWSLDSQSTLPNVRLSTPGKVSALTCTPNGSYIIAAVDEKLFIWQLCSGRLLRNIARHYQTITCLRCNSDGSLFASGGEDGIVFVWSFSQVLNKEDCTPLHNLSNHTLPVKDICFSGFSYRCRLYTVSLDRTANIYEAITGTLLLKLICDVPLTALTLNVLESELFIGCVNGSIHKFNLHEPPRGIEHHIQVQSQKDNKVYTGHSASVVCLSVSIDCRTLLSASLDKFIHLWDIPSRQILRTIENKGAVTSAFFTKRHINFHTPDIKLTSRTIAPHLQRVYNENDGDPIEVITATNNSNNYRIDEFLNFEAYVKNGEDASQASDEQLAHKITTMNEEIERLKKINLQMYRFNVKHILERGKNRVTPNVVDPETQEKNDDEEDDSLTLLPINLYGHEFKFKERSREKDDNMGDNL